MTRGDISSENVKSGWSWGCSMPTSRISQGLQVKAPTLRLHVHNSHGHLHRVQGSPLILGFKSGLGLSLLPVVLRAAISSHTLNSHGSSHGSSLYLGVWCNTSFPDSLSRSETIHMVTLTQTQRCYFQGFPSEICDLPKYICSFFLSAKHRPMR